MCGIIGIIKTNHPPNLYTNWAARQALYGISSLQHRGQDAAGMLTWSPNLGIQNKKDFGLVNNIFNTENISKMQGPMAMAHTRYATVGRNHSSDLQPMFVEKKTNTAQVGMIHNGNLLNYHPLKNKLEAKYGFKFNSQNDIELILHLWHHYAFRNAEDIKNFSFDNVIEGAKAVFNQTVGAMAICGIISGVGLVGMRDPNSIRPIVLGRRQSENGSSFDYALASETKALDLLGFELVKDLKGGEVILIDLDGHIHSKVIAPKVPAPCMFEWVYFAGAESSIMGQSIYTARLNLGRVLSKKVKHHINTKAIAPDIVCPVPDTARTASIALAEEIQLPYREGLMKNRYIQRSFILKDQKERERAVEAKLFPVRSEVMGKNILLIDDSLVRGTTARRIISMLKKFGAKNITLALTCPPIRYGCYYGVDFPDSSELFASNYGQNEVASMVGADMVIFLDEEDLINAIGISSMCMACVNKKYPTCTEGAQEFSNKRRIEAV